MILPGAMDKTKKEISRINKERIAIFGVHPLCLRCLWECKIANAQGLTKFWCREVKEKY